MRTRGRRASERSRPSLPDAVLYVVVEDPEHRGSPHPRKLCWELGKASSIGLGAGCQADLRRALVLGAEDACKSKRRKCNAQSLEERPVCSEMDRVAFEHRQGSHNDLPERPSLQHHALAQSHRLMCIRKSTLDCRYASLTVTNSKRSFHHSPDQSSRYEVSMLSRMLSSRGVHPSRSGLPDHFVSRATASDWSTDTLM